MTPAEAGRALPAMPLASPGSAGAVPPAARWHMHCEAAARALFLLAAIGSVTSPPVCNIGAFLGLLAYAGSPQAWPRLRAAARRPLGRGILVLLAVLGAATLWAGDASWARRFAAWWSWRPLILVLVGSALFDSAPAKDRYARTFVAAMALAAVASFALRFSPHPVFIDDPGVLLRNHTTQGMAFVVAALLAVMLAWGRPVGRRERWLLMAAAVLFVANIVSITTGRSAHVALLVAVIVGGAARLGGRRRWLAWLVVPVLAAGLLAASPMVRERFEMVQTEVGTVDNAPVATSSGIRLYVWSTTWELITRRPLLGYGMGGFVPAYHRLIHEHVVDSANWRDASRAQDTHNEYLHLLVEAGMLGLLAFGFFVVGALRQAAPAPYRTTAVATLFAWLATSLFNSHFQTFAEAHLLGLVLGTLLAPEGLPPVEGGTGYAAAPAGSTVAAPVAAGPPSSPSASAATAA